jgi:ParB family transcriptional regulator, chromosome partitioning protein
MFGKCEVAKRIGSSRADAIEVKLRTVILALRPDQIEPDPGQPRKDFDEESLARLAESLRKFSQLQPLLVRKEGPRYVLVAGERRWRAAKLAGMSTVQAILCRGGDARSIQLVENLLRENLKPVEQARAYAEMMAKEGWSARELGRQLSLEHTGITRALKLLDLDDETQALVDKGKIPPTSAYEISKRPRKEQTRLAREVAAGRIKGDDLRGHKRAPVLTPGKPSTWIHLAGKIKVTVTGHLSHDEVASALEKALKAATSGKMPLAGGLGRC